MPQKETLLTYEGLKKLEEELEYLDEDYYTQEALDEE